jgi:predicted MFS family arabinose efflux permease
VSPVAGPLVDRMNRRTLLVVSDVVRALLALGLIVAHRAESLVALYTCHVLMVAMTGVFFPARSAAIPQLVGEEELGTANALSGGTWSVMLALGAALGGWVTATVGTDASIALDSLSFLVSAGLLLLLPSLPAPGADAHHDRSFGAGLRHLASHRRTLALASLKPLMALGGGALLLIPVYGTTVFPDRGGPAWVGFLYCARGLGALVGSLVLIRVFGESSRAMRRVILGAFPVAGVAFILLGRAGSIEAAAVSFFVAAIASGAIWVMSGTLLQRHGDPKFLGRIFSVEFGTMTLVVSATAWAAGVGLDATPLGPAEIATISGALLFVPFLLWGSVLVVERRREERGREERVAPPPLGVAPEVFEAAPEPEEEPE